MGKTSKLDNSLTFDSKVQKKRKSNHNDIAIQKMVSLKNKKAKKNKTDPAKTDSVAVNKKIIFHDDSPVEVIPEKEDEKEPQIAKSKSKKAKRKKTESESHSGAVNKNIKVPVEVMPENVDVSIQEIATSKNEKMKKKKTKPANSNSVTINKKIIFHDDAAVEEVAEKKVVPSKIGIKKKNTQFDPDDESEVKDEDIDAFCDEIDEEDNVQYDNWVKLLEKKLGPNKCKPK